jgi:DNA-binding YbaB/EbfC family protein
MSKGFRGGFGSQRPNAGSGGTNMQKMLQQAQKMQAEMGKEQEELNAMEFTAQSGGGMVKVVLDGAKHFKSIEINPEAVDPDEVEMLQDLVTAAVNAGLEEVDRVRDERLGKYTEGLPSGLGF